MTETGYRSLGRRIIDLSLSIDNNMRGVSITPSKTLSVDGWNATNLQLYSHCGTHMDAPKHFVEGAASIDTQAIEACCGPAKVINLVPTQPRQLITPQQIESSGVNVQPGDRLLLRTDWHKRYGTQEYRDELPRISLELAQWLVQRRVALVGVEPPSVADVNEIVELTQVHQTLFHGNVVIVEGLAHLDQLTQSMVVFIALPLKIASGDGCPVRAIAIELND